MITIPRALPLTAAALAVLLPLKDIQDKPTQSKPATVAVGPDIAKLAWITGVWRKSDAKQVLEESWNPPLGNSMTGTLRWLKKDVGWVYEFLLIEKTKKGVTFYLRHLGPGSVAWEPVDKPLDFPLKSVGKREAVFEHPTRTKMKRLIYSRSKDGVLTVRVEGVSSSGKKSANVFRFERVE
jgi:hypothetical protein